MPRPSGVPADCRASAPEGLVAEFNDVTVDRNDFAPTMQHKFDECKQIGGDLDESMRQYLGDVYQIDRNVDRLLTTLDELGLRDNTIVVFSSDHGPAPVVLGKQTARKYSYNMLGYAGQFRGGQHEQYEGGTRVPYIIRWPDKVEAGRVDTQNVCSFIDWMPTLCAIAGVDELPNPIDGEDVSDIWFGSDRERTKPLFWKSSAPAAHQRCGTATGNCICHESNAAYLSSMTCRWTRTKAIMSLRSIQMS